MREMSPILLSVVLPAHNEAQNIAAMADRLAEFAGPAGTYEIIFADDGSIDGTLAAIKELAARNKAVRYVVLTRNFGHQAALRAGLRHARGSAVILMDCDFEHPPEVLPDLLTEWRNGAEIVLTKRRSPRRFTSAKQLTSKLFYRLLEAIGDIHIEFGSADFLLLDRKVVDAINAFDNQDVFLRGLVRWLGFKQSTVLYTAGTRTSGEPSFTPARMVELALSGIVAHSIKPLRLAIYLAFGFATIGMLFVGYSLVSFLWIPHTVVGWTSVIGAIAILGAGQLFVLGVIGEYIGRTLREARKWPAYVIAETEADLAGTDSVAPTRGARAGL
jgi:glycosyltransferase involved in cell wall biosynthesis